MFSLGDLLSKIVSFLLLAVFTSALSPKEFGDAELIITATTLLIPIFTICISGATLRFLISDEDKNKCISVGLTFTFLGIVLLLAAYPLLSKVQVLHDYYPYFVLLFLGDSVQRLFFGISKGYDKIKICAFTSLVSVLTIVLCSFIFLKYLKLGIFGYLLALIVAHFVSCVYLALGGKVFKHFSFSFSKPLAKEMLSYSIPIVPTSVAWWINATSDRYLITIFLGSAFTGLYSAAARIPNILAFVSSLFFQAWQLSGIKEFGSKEYSNFFSEVYNIFSVIYLCVCSVLICCIPIISDLLFRGDFTTSWKYVPFLIIGSLFAGLGGVISPAYEALKKTKLLMISTIFGALIGIGINIVFLPKYGLLIPTIASPISFLIVWIIRLKLLGKHIKLIINWKVTIFSIMVLITQSVLLLIGHTKYLPIIIGLCLVTIVVCIWSVRTQIPRFLKMVFANKRVGA